MKRLPIAVTVLVCVLTIAGQGEQRVTVSDLPEMVKRGLKVINSRPHRYTTNFERKRTVTLEVDAKGSIRVKSFDGRDGQTGECVVIGERIYHRYASGPWISQTKEEFDKSQVALAAAMKDARSKRDTEAHERARGATLNNLAIFFATWRPTINGALILSADFRNFDRTLEFLGNLPYKDKVARFYRLRGKPNDLTPPTKHPELRMEYVYVFDRETGALLKAETRHDWVYESKPRTSLGTDEWEPDPSIVIDKPVLSESPKP